MAKIDISHKTIFFVAAFIGAVWFVFRIRDILFLIFISFILMSAVRPYVDALERRKVPRVLAIISVYIVGALLVAGIAGSIMPTLITQMTVFVNSLPRYLAVINPLYQIDFNSVVNQIAPISQNVLKVTVNVFSNVVTMLTVLVFTFYLLMERNRILKSLGIVLSEDLSEKVVRSVVSVEEALGGWLRGQLTLMLLVGMLTYIGLTFLGVDFALPLAIIAGLLEIVPVIGPIISSVPAILVALTVSPLFALSTGALFFIVQQIENNFIVPLVMNRAVGLSPLIVIIALMIGSNLAGTIGTILAIPIVVTVRAIVRANFRGERERTRAD